MFLRNYDNNITNNQIYCLFSRLKKTSLIKFYRNNIVIKIDKDFNKDDVINTCEKELSIIKTQKASSLSKKESLLKNENMYTILYTYNKQYKIVKKNSKYNIYDVYNDKYLFDKDKEYNVYKIYNGDVMQKIITTEKLNNLI